MTVDIQSEELAQQEAATARFAERAQERAETRRILKQPGGIAEADSPERIAKRLDRLSRYYARDPLPVVPSETPAGEPEQVLISSLARMARSIGAPMPEVALEVPAPTAEVMLEAVINNPDFLDIRYLEAGVTAARAVCRVVIRDSRGRLVGYGTGSLVSPRLLLTNHHVLPSEAVAQASGAEFNYQDGVDGQPLPTRLFRLDPRTFFAADRERDFALVAVQPDGGLSDFGFNRLIEAEGKAIIGESVTIIQHPGGEKKQIALRENQIVDLLEAFLHYITDTREGSSGSLVFNDQWEVVGLHHASIRAPEHEEFGGILNEGIRISRIIKFLRALELDQAKRELLTELVEPERITLAAVQPRPTPLPAQAGAPSSATANELQADVAAARLAPAARAAVRFSVPLEFTMRLGTAPADEPDALVVASELPADELEPAELEAVRIDPDYGSRRGYDADFLGAGEHSVPLPSLSEELRAKAATFQAGDGTASHVLPYHHFSVAHSRERRLAFFTASNIDGRRSRRLKRERDRWFLDPRIPAADQTGEPVYADNDLDRGHLVRRLDPAWGSARQAKRANDDTFHFTNCTPQHKDFNQNQTTWAGLEDYVLENADNRDLRINVFTGPVFADDDHAYRGVQLPRQFWKIVSMVKETGQLSATAYLLSQESLLQDFEVLEERAVVLEEFEYGAYRTFQVPIPRVEALTGLEFGALRDADPLAGLEAAVETREIRTPGDLVL